MRDRDWAAVVIALLLAIGGFGVVGAPSTGSTDVLTDGQRITVEGEGLSFNASTVYERVGEMHGKDRSELPSATIYLRERPESTESYTPSPFEQYVGIERMGDTGPAAYAQGQRIVLYTDVVETPAMREQVLAHEMAHLIQFQENVPMRVDRGVSGTGAAESHLELAIIEGAATYVEHRYAVEYIEGSSEPPTWAERRRNRTQLGAFVLSHYHFGQRYVAQRVDSPAELDEVYDDPPQTTEQLIHGYDTDEQLPPELPVTVEGLGDDYRIDDRRTKGELFVRIVLEGELDLDRAAEAAAGWGNDELVAIESREGNMNYAWVLRWDSPEDAEAFAAAKRDFLDRATGDRLDGLWREDGATYDVHRAGEETVVLFVGDAGFVEGASADVQGDEVTVTIEGDRDARVEDELAASVEGELVAGVEGELTADVAGDASTRVEGRPTASADGNRGVVDAWSAGTAGSHPVRGAA